MLHVVKETGTGIIVRDARYETAAACANPASPGPAIADRSNSDLSEHIPVKAA
jgi:4-hydroxyphenylacetate 3-monooxygenase